MASSRPALGLLRSILQNLDREAKGAVVDAILSIESLDPQTRIREILTTAFQRNSIFAVKIGSQNRITIPEAEVEKLHLKPGDFVQVGLFKVEQVHADGVDP